MVQKGFTHFDRKRVEEVILKNESRYLSMLFARSIWSV